MKRLCLAALALAGCAHHDPACSDCERTPDGAVEHGDGGPVDGLALDAPGQDAAPTPDAMFVPPDPFTVDTACAAMTFAQLVTFFPPGGTSAGGGQFTLTSRSRASCNEITGCSAWNSPSPVQLQQIFDRGGYPSGTPHAMPATGSTSLELDASSPATIRLDLWNAEPGMASNTIRFRCDQVRQGGVADSLDCSVQVEVAGDYPSLLWFVDTYAGQPLFDNTTMVSWHGRICQDGRYQLVTKLAAELGTSVTGANNRNQLAIYGQL